MKNKKVIPFLIAAVLVTAVLIIGVIMWNMRSDPRVFITQYADETGLQAMFYTIEKDGQLVVIDGGNAGNANYVQSIIDQKGGHVNAWILTHPHPDHIEAFNILWSSMESEIDAVYAPEYDYVAYAAKAQEWDGFPDFETFLDLMSETDKLHYLHREDEIELLGMRMQVFNAYDAYVDEVSKDIANDASLMLKFTNKEESMLFCSDVGSIMSGSIIAAHWDEMECDYLQMGHHGNGGLPEDFYKLVKPKAAFFDAPEWLMNPGEGASYTTPANRALMESMGAQIYYYNGAPNRIELK